MKQFGLICLAILGTSAAWGQQIYSLANNCVQTTTTFASCNLAQEKASTTDASPASIGPGMYGNAGIYDIVDALSGSGAYGVLHASASGSLSISGADATIWADSGSSFGDVLTISDPALTGQTGYLQVGYGLHATITSSGVDQGSILVMGTDGVIGASGTTYSASVFTSSVNGSFLIPQTFTFTYGQPFNFSLGMWAAVGTGTWLVDPSSTFDFDYGFGPAIGTGSAVANASDTLVLNELILTDSNGNPVNDATFSSASGTTYGYNGVTPEPSTQALLALPAIALLLFGYRRKGLAS